MPPYAWLFDVDGVICHPEQKKVTEPGIITEIIKRLQKGEPVALVTGRSVEFMREKVITRIKEKIPNQSLLQNFLAVGEKGGVILTFDSLASEQETTDDSISVPSEMQEEAKRLVAKKYSKEAFFDLTKRTMISLEMTDHFPLAEFTKAQKLMDQDIKLLIKKYNQDNRFLIDSSTISTDIQNKHVGKDFAARHVLSWLKQKNISPHHFITMGDSSSDVAMAQEIQRQNLPVTFVFVGDSHKIDPQKYSFPVVFTKNRYELGTLEYLQQS